MPDAIVVGSGPNGLVAANVLASSGWDVLVLEAQPDPGGAVRSAELTAPGFVNDMFSAFYPLAVASPVLRALGLERHGLVWRRSPLVLAHPLPDGRCAVLSQDLDETAASLDSFAAGDGGAWRQLYAEWERIGDLILKALVSPFPPIRPALRLAARLGPSGGLRFARENLLSVRRLGEERFAGEGGPLLLTGISQHTDVSPEAAGSGVFGWLLACVGQQYGFPVPEGGAGALAAALVRRLEGEEGRVLCDAPVDRVTIRDGRAVGVETRDGRRFEAAAVLADTDALSLYLRLVGAEHLPNRLLDDLHRFQWDAATVKVDWALSGPVPWTAEPARRSATLHLADSVDHMSWYQNHIATGRIPRDPYLVMGQMAVADPTRAPEGCESVWAYTHVPQRVRGDAGGDLTGRWTPEEADTFADRMEGAIERYAPGFRDLVLARHVMTPAAMEAANANLAGGAINAGTAQLHQQLVFRPVPGLARAETVIPGLYLASASAHPGGGVHGAPGANAARAALAHHRLRRLTALSQR